LTVEGGTVETSLHVYGSALMGLDETLHREG